MSIVVGNFSGREICIAGVGKMFYQDGFPISMSISELKKKNIQVSIFHVADECLKNGWSPKTTYNKLEADFRDDIDQDNKYDFEALRQFVYADYEEQREMIFNYLFGFNSNNISNENIKQLSNYFYGENNA